MDQNSVKFMLLNYGKSYFSKAEEYTQLQQLFIKDTFYENLSVWIDMFVSPLYILISFIYNKSLSIFTISSLQKTVSIWIKWVRFQTLKNEIREWIKIVKSIGGPFISTNDPTYHMFVYADGMTRLEMKLLGDPILAKKGAKSL